MFRRHRFILTILLLALPHCGRVGPSYVRIINSDAGIQRDSADLVDTGLDQQIDTLHDSTPDTAITDGNQIGDGINTSDISDSNTPSDHSIHDIIPDTTVDSVIVDAPIVDAPIVDPNTLEVLAIEPLPGSILPGETVTFDWSGNSDKVKAWWLYVGTFPGGKTIVDTGDIGAKTSHTVSGLPTNGSPVWVRLWYKLFVVWKYFDFRYTAAAPTFISPIPGSVLTGSTVTFTWKANGIDVLDWWVWAYRGNQTFFDSGPLGKVFSITVNKLPTDGGPITLRLWYKTKGAWNFLDFSYITSGSS